MNVRVERHVEHAGVGPAAALRSLALSYPLDARVITTNVNINAPITSATRRATPKLFMLYGSEGSSPEVFSVPCVLLPDVHQELQVALGGPHLIDEKLQACNSLEGMKNPTQLPDQ